jgi:RNase P subunit RPR2
MSDGPKDRFKKTQHKNAEQRRQDQEEQKAIARADEGKEFVCRNCRRWLPRSYFEYEFDGEVKLATRCDSCREENRQRYRRRG